MISCYFTNTDSSERSVSSRVAAHWEDRWVRFRIALKKRGVELMHQDSYRSWVLAWIRFIKPRKFEEGNQQDVEGFLRHLDAVSKKGWQITGRKRPYKSCFRRWNRGYGRGTGLRIWLSFRLAV
jgi:hypothetical protein